MLPQPMIDAEILQLLGLLMLASLGAIAMTGRRAWPTALRNTVVVICLMVLSFASTGLLIKQVDVWIISLAAISAYQAFSMARLLKDRIDIKQPKHWNFLRHTVRHTSLWLASAQLIIANTYILLQYYGHVGAVAVDYAGVGKAAGLALPMLYALASLQLAAAIIIAWSARRQLHKTNPRPAKLNIHSSSVPSVTVAIPARNEDAQLEACLSAVLASDYPKLEILVLDDCSSDRTPDIIRSFAHAGVRFIRYESDNQPSDSSAWLAKNLAYERLYHEASGSLILFCGVDIRLGRHSIQQLVATMQRRHKSMVSILPLNNTATRLPVVQAARYAWEMLLPRRLFNRPPALSSCWMVDRAALTRWGGFAAVKRSVTPEAHFARAAATSSDGYSFIRSSHDKRSRICSDKPLEEQYTTAIHTRYPQLHRRVEMVLLVSVAEAALFLIPLYVAYSAIITLHIALFAMAAIALWLNIHAFSRLQRAVFPNLKQSPAWWFVPAVIIDIAMLHYSMYKYEFSAVYWKGRNVCYPVMRVVPRLPDLPKVK